MDVSDCAFVIRFNRPLLGQLHVVVFVVLGLWAKDFRVIGKASLQEAKLRGPHMTGLLLRNLNYVTRMGIYSK